MTETLIDFVWFQAIGMFLMVINWCRHEDDDFEWLMFWRSMEWLWKEWNERGQRWSEVNLYFTRANAIKPVAISNRRKDKFKQWNKKLRSLPNLNDLEQLLLYWSWLSWLKSIKTPYKNSIRISIDSFGMFFTTSNYLSW